LAGLHCGMYQSQQDLAQQWRAQATFEPRISRDQAQAQMAQWEHAVRQTTAA